MEREAREFDLILWGATGYTGALVAEHLAARCDAEDPPVAWALGGRDEAKLRALRDRLGVPNVDIVLGDALDPGGMAALAQRTRVVCSTVGPYARYGDALVAACAQAGTDYCDLSGEIPWVRRMIREHEAEAVASGARIVPSCGRKGLRLCVDTSALGERPGELRQAVAAAVRDSAVRRTVLDPHALTPSTPDRAPAARDGLAPHFSRAFGAWTAPFVGATIDTRVVRRSQALLADRYGPVRYREVQLSGRGLAGAVRAFGRSLALLGGVAALAIGPVRRLVGARLPAPGEGPDAETRRRGSWELRFAAEPPAGVTAAPVMFVVRGENDPGYGSTARMLGEAALCLARDDIDVPGRFHTPASALGEALLARLEAHAGVTFAAA